MDNSSAVKASFVERYALDKLFAEWLNACGFYILFSHIRDDGSFDAYVGKASNGFSGRLREHDEKKDFWRVALLIRRDTTYGLTSTESLYLEGRMRNILTLSPNVKVHNIAPTGDRTLPDHDKQEMESIVLSTLRIMFLRGYRNSSMGYIADSITAETIKGFEPARTMPTYPISDIHQVSPATDIPHPIPELAGTSSFAEVEARFNSLKVWRLARAETLGWKGKPYLVFSNSELNAMATLQPKTLDELAKISGVGPKKLADYGTEILDVLAVKP
jgi:superfamily II DNA helicase RecQ